MRIFAISANGEMYNIGENENEKKWHSLDSKVIEHAKAFTVGDEIDVNVERRGGTWCIIYMGKPGSKPKGEDINTTVTKDNSSGQRFNEKSSDISESIKRQAIGHATSRVIAGLSASLTPDNVIDLMNKVYKKFQELVG